MPTPGSNAAELDIDARLQTAREQFQERLAHIKHDLLLGQAELSATARRPAAAAEDAWSDAGQVAGGVDSSFPSSGSGTVNEEQLTAQVRPPPCVFRGAFGGSSPLQHPPTARPTVNRGTSLAVCAQAAQLRESLAGFFDELYPPTQAAGRAAEGGGRPAAALEQSRQARERALAHVQALKEQVSMSVNDGHATGRQPGSPATRPIVIDDADSSEEAADYGGRQWKEGPARRRDAASYQMRARQPSSVATPTWAVPTAASQQRQRYGSVSGLTARKPRGRYRASAWAASSSGRFPPGKQMSDPGAYDPPAGMLMDSNAKFPGGQPLPTAAFDSTSKRFPDHGSIWRPPADQGPGPGRYDPTDADDWMLDCRRHCYNF